MQKAPASTKAKEVAKQTYDLFQQLNESLGDRAPFEVKDLIKFGSNMHPHTYEGEGTDDKEALDRLTNSVISGTIENADMLKLLLTLPNEQCMIMWAARWVDQGCPRFVFDSKYASLLMSTDVGKEMLDKVVFPWKAFLIDMPDNLLTSDDDQGNSHTFSRVFVQIMTDQFGDQVLNILATAPTGIQLWRHSVPLDLLTSCQSNGAFSWGFGQDCNTRDHRIMNLLGRLIISMCVALSDPDNFHKQMPRKKSRKRKYISTKYPSTPLPEVQTFVIGRPTKINCRPAIIEYIEGKTRRSSPTVQFLVRGHWRYQAYGPGRAKRKLIRIDPFWKGPEDAKILARTVRMEEDKSIY